jgi:hypothetical protein
MGDGGYDIKAYLADARLLRPTRIGRLLRSFRLHSPCYARKRIAEISSMGVALATTIISELGFVFSGRSCLLCILIAVSYRRDNLRPSCFKTRRDSIEFASATREGLAERQKLVRLVFSTLLLLFGVQIDEH